MHMRTLGVNGLQVSALGMGVMGVGGVYGPRDRTQAIEALNRALELEVSFFDTADIYGDGLSEQIIGEAFAGKFDQVQIATKCGLIRHEGWVRVDGTPEHIRTSCERSLRRLGVEKIDLYFLHRADPRVPIEDSIGALVELKQAGKICHLGLSEASAGTLRRAAAVHPIAALQSEYSVLTRHIEASVLPTCRELGIGLVAFSPLGRGLLTGAVRSQQDISGEGDQRARTAPRFKPENLSVNLELVDVIAAIGRAHGATPAQVTLAWILAKADNFVPIPGASRRVTIEDNARAAEVRLTLHDIETLNGLAERVAGIHFPQNSATAGQLETPARS